MYVLDLSLSNKLLYDGCVIEELPGKKNLLTPPIEASYIICNNLQKILDSILEKNEISLTGGMAIWAYLLVFHMVVHRFKKVYYDDAKGMLPLLIAAHG